MTMRGVTAAAAAFLALASPALADDFGQWGLWGGPPKANAAAKVVKVAARTSEKADRTDKAAKKPVTAAALKAAPPIADGVAPTAPVTLAAVMPAPAAPAATAPATDTATDVTEIADANAQAEADKSSDNADGGKDTPKPADKAVVKAADKSGDKPSDKSGDKAEDSSVLKPQAPDIVRFDPSYGVNVVVVDIASRKLYYTLPDGKAFSYPIGIGREGYAFTGTDRVAKVVEWPEWTPSDEPRDRNSGPARRMAGGPRNPLGAYQISLGTPLFRIHGTNDPDSIGTADGPGCIRMQNNHIAHLAVLVDPGTEVHVMSALPGASAAVAGPRKEGDNI